MRIGLLGSGIGRSMAPAFHELAGRLMGVPITYDLLEHDENDGAQVGRLIRRYADAGYHALNVTHPFKERAFAHARVDDPSVVAVAAVNTLLLDPDGAPPRGHNTDFSGLCRRWRWRWAGRQPGPVAVLGAGGVGRAAAFAFGELGASSVRLFDLDATRATRLRASLVERFPSLETRVCASAEDAVTGADGIVNGTPMGMYIAPGTPVDLAAVGAQRWLFDAVYSPIETPLVRHGAAVGLDVLSGFELFLGQGVDAFEHFTGRRMPDGVAAEVENSMWTQVRARDERRDAVARRQED